MTIKSFHITRNKHGRKPNDLPHVPKSKDSKTVYPFEGVLRDAVTDTLQSGVDTTYLALMLQEEIEKYEARCRAAGNHTEFNWEAFKESVANLRLVAPRR